MLKIFLFVALFVAVAFAQAEEKESEDADAREGKYLISSYGYPSYKSYYGGYRGYYGYPYATMRYPVYSHSYYNRVAPVYSSYRYSTPYYNKYWY